MAVAGNRLNRTRDYVDPFGYCDELLVNIPAFPGGEITKPLSIAARAWCSAASQVDPPDSDMAGLLAEGELPDASVIDVSKVSADAGNAHR
jgi:hypothetical protein